MRPSNVALQPQAQPKQSVQFLKTKFFYMKTKSLAAISLCLEKHKFGIGVLQKMVLNTPSVCLIVTYRIDCHMIGVCLKLSTHNQQYILFGGWG